MSKESIRENIQRLKSESKIILDSDKTSSEAKFFIQSMLSMMEIIVAVLLEKKTRKNSSNSGLPPSQNNGSNGNRNGPGGKSAGLGSESSNVIHQETSETVAAEFCQKCDGTLEDAKIVGREERKKIDVYYQVVNHIVISEHR